jgi:hypothetical protein
MNGIFQDLILKFVLVFFFDDILIYSQTWEEHLQHLTTEFKILWANRLYVKKEKSNFGQKRISYLGHIIDQEGFYMDLEKITAMLNWPKPNTLKTLRGFLGLIGSSFNITGALPGH